MHLQLRYRSQLKIHRFTNVPAQQHSMEETQDFFIQRCNYLRSLVDDGVIEKEHLPSMIKAIYLGTRGAGPGTRVTDNGVTDGQVTMMNILL